MIKYFNSSPILSANTAHSCSLTVNICVRSIVAVASRAVGFLPLEFRKLQYSIIPRITTGGKPSYKSVVSLMEGK